MSAYNFTKMPQKVPYVKTKYRSIQTEIPSPKSLEILKNLERYESRSMHGQLPVVWDRAVDFCIFDDQGNSWIDFTSTIFLANTGHSNPAVLKALEEQIREKLIHTYNFAHDARAEFLKKLCEITPGYLEKSFLMSAGTEATECALKLMRMHGRKDSPSRNVIISFKGSMHGRTMGSEMLKGDPDSSAWIGYKDPNMRHIPFPYPWLAKSSFKRDIEALEGEGLQFQNIAGFMIESYQGWGAIFYPKSYIKELFDFAGKHGALVAFDDIQGGFGRTGKLFAYQHYEVEPDLVCLGKALSGGLPLSAVMGRGEIMDLPETGSMSSTHSANPLSCRAALANIEEMESKDLTAESARKGEILHRHLNKLKDKYPECISYVFGRGLLAALIITDPATRKPDGLFASRICEKAMQKGLLLVHTGRESIKIGPPLTISDDAVEEGVEVLEESIMEIKEEVLSVS